MSITNTDFPRCFWFLPRGKPRIQDPALPQRTSKCLFREEPDYSEIHPCATFFPLNLLSRCGIFRKLRRAPRCPFWPHLSPAKYLKESCCWLYRSFQTANQSSGSECVQEKLINSLIQWQKKAVNGFFLLLLFFLSRSLRLFRHTARYILPQTSSSRSLSAVTVMLERHL